MDIKENSLQLHEQWSGKLDIISKCKLSTKEDLSIAYTPGVAAPCEAIAQNPEDAYKYTIKGNTIAVISDGSAVLGLGNIGPYAALPVMEGKAVLFKEFAGVNAFPICLNTQDSEEIIQAIVAMAPSFGGINLEDISAPRCFYIEEKLKELLDIPVFHDDQHGTAIVVLAGLINALKVVRKKANEVKVVINGAGSAGIAITRLLYTYGFKNITVCDLHGILSSEYPKLNPVQKQLLEISNLDNHTGFLEDALDCADVFVGVSAPNILSSQMVSRMNKDGIVFALANPNPEIIPDEAKYGGARIVATGRSDFPNQVNNVLAFPGIFKGALMGRARQISEAMKLAAAKAIAGLISASELNENNILPEPFDPRLCDTVSDAVLKNI